MNAPINFAFRDKSMRVVLIADEPWWVANDLCAILDIRNPRNALQRIPSDLKGVRQMDTLGGKQSVALLSEPGMWMLVFRSDKAEAEAVRDLMCREVLPSLRKHGRYEMAGFDPPPVEPMDLDPVRMSAGVAVVREARRLFGPGAARHLWAQVGLPPCVADGAGEAQDPFAEPLAAWAADKAMTTIQQAAEGMGLSVVDGASRHRIGALLAGWGWTQKTEKVARGKAARVYRRPPPGSLTVDVQAREVRP